MKSSNGKGPALKGYHRPELRAIPAPSAMADPRLTRIREHPILTFAERQEVEFFFEDQCLRGYRNEPIAAALAANGIQVYRFTEKMHRARGFFCAVGKCSSCLMEVDGRPNVMVCMEPLKSGMRVRRQVGRGKIRQAALQSADIKLQNAE
jgi:hypothetical protein